MSETEEIENTVKKLAAVEGHKAAIDRLVFAHLANMAKLPECLEEFIQNPNEDTVAFLETIFTHSDTSIKNIREFINQIAVTLFDNKPESEDETIQALADENGIRLK